MSADSPNLWVLANCGRSIAQSAVRGGFAVTVFDRFCDADTQALASCHRLVQDPADMAPGTLAQTLGAAPTGGAGLVYGAGLEGAGQLLNNLPAGWVLHGNSAEVLDLLGDPQRWLALLDELGLDVPPSRLSPPPAADPRFWLRKRSRSSGGLGVRHWSGDPAPSAPLADEYFQQYRPGPVFSVLFIADGQHGRIIGFNRLSTVRIGAALPFVYAGAIGGLSLPPAIRQILAGWVERLIGRLGLRGLNSIDFLLDQDRPLLLELNARPTATVELYESRVSGGWLSRHVEACQGRLPAGEDLHDACAVSGHRVVYSERGLSVPNDMTWPDWCRDRPPGASHIGAGEPVCSVYAEGPDAPRVEALLAERRQHLLNQLQGVADA